MSASPTTQEMCNSQVQHANAQGVRLSVKAEEPEGNSTCNSIQNGAAENKPKPEGYNLTEECFGDNNNNCHCQAMIIFICILSFLVLIPLMVLSSLILVFRIHCYSLRPHSLKLYIIITATIIIFLIFAIPMRILNLLNITIGYLRSADCISILLFTRQRTAISAIFSPSGTEYGAPVYAELVQISLTSKEAE
ncbi:Proto-oncogene Mas [Platysternon megacephalum]|uniref:Proto-oncogene Mas n=1 Tax=Platysternon megacephalum TaxID=55544 RepID=A0A4D9E1J0_9SAUR|nr:Proto-oncogene Mas [Platysternon megacephalum]